MRVSYRTRDGEMLQLRQSNCGTSCRVNQPIRGRKVFYTKLLSTLKKLMLIISFSLSYLDVGLLVNTFTLYSQRRVPPPIPTFVHSTWIYSEYIIPVPIKRRVCGPQSRSGCCGKHKISALTGIAMFYLVFPSGPQKWHH
jgi:hypothetical protein